MFLKSFLEKIGFLKKPKHAWSELCQGGVVRRTIAAGTTLQKVQTGKLCQIPSGVSQKEMRKGDCLVLWDNTSTPSWELIGELESVGDSF